MPKLTRWFIKASLLYLAIALGIGAWLAASRLGMPAPVGLSPVYLHLFLVGWVTQIIFGVAYWMLPKFSRQRPHRSESMAWAVFWLLNSGLVLRGLTEPQIGRGNLWANLLVLSAVMQWLAGFLFVWNSWGRVKER